MNLLAIDPGPKESGWCLYDVEARRVLDSGIKPNNELLLDVQWTKADVAIEMVASYGMAVGREVFETVLWIGRFVQGYPDPAKVRLIYRRDVKLYICQTARATDANIRQELKDRLGGVGTKKEPGPLYGLKGHAWSALAVAVTAGQGLAGPLFETRAQRSDGAPF